MLIRRARSTFLGIFFNTLQHCYAEATTGDVQGSVKSLDRAHNGIPKVAQIKNDPHSRPKIDAIPAFGRQTNLRREA